MGLFSRMPFRGIRFQLSHKIELQCDLVSIMVPHQRHIAETKTRLSQGWRQKFSDRGAGASDRGAKMTERWCFRALFCQISSDGGPPTEVGCSPLALPWRHPWAILLFSHLLIVVGLFIGPLCKKMATQQLDWA